MRRLVTALSVLVVVLSCSLVLTFDYGRDQAIYAVVARETLAGGMPYRDVFDFKPPGIFLVYTLARALFGSAQYGIRILEVASMLATAAGMVRLAREHFGDRTIGFVAAAISSQIEAQLDFWHTAQPETFGGMLTILALVAATSALGASSKTRAFLFWALSGALFGAAGLMKPTLAGGGVVLAAWAIARGLRARQSRFTLLAPPFAIAIGGTLSFAVVLLWFASRGALRDLYDVLFVFTPGYTKIGWENASALAMLGNGAYACLLQHSGIVILGLIALLVCRPTATQRPFALVLLALTAVHVVGVALQGKFFAYHVAATFPITALLSALGIVRAFERTAAYGPVARAALILVFAIGAALRAPVPSFGPRLLARSYGRFQLFVRGPMVIADRDALASVVDVHAGENRAVASFVASRTQPDDPIYVWGFECVIYDLAKRPLSSRYIYDVPQRASWSRERMRALLMKDLVARKPAAIVVEHGDDFNMVTGNDFDSAESLVGFSDLRELVHDEYGEPTSIGHFDVYLRNDAPH